MKPVYYLASRQTAAIFDDMFYVEWGNLNLQVILICRRRRRVCVVMTSMSWLLQGTGLVTRADMHRFARQCLVKVGAREYYASVVADVIVAADECGIRSQGFNKLPVLLQQIQRRQVDARASPVVLQETPASAWVNGHNALGPVVADFCMQLAVEKAQRVGVAVVAAKGSNYIGIASHYSTKALEKGLIGICCTNTPPCVVPTRGTKAFLGLNPLSVAAPSLCEDSLLVDLSTSAVGSLSELQLLAMEGRPLPQGDPVALDERGAVATDAATAARARALLPLGGLEDTGGHKGTCLALMVEALCGVLAGGAYAKDVPLDPDPLASPALASPLPTPASASASASTPSAPGTAPGSASPQRADLCQCFVAIDPKAFAPGFEVRVFDLTYRLREGAGDEEDKAFMVPGDRKREALRRAEAAAGLSYTSHQLSLMMELAERLGVEPVRIK